MLTLFFDLDGTLSDPYPGIAASIAYACQKMDLSLPDDAAMRSFVGPPLIDTLTAMTGSAPLGQRALAFFRERYASTGLFENTLYKGTISMLEQVTAKGYDCHVVTSKPQPLAENILKYFDIDRFFLSIKGPPMDEAPHVKSDLLNDSLTRFRIEPKQALMIGDRRFDIAAAQHCGTHSAAALWGYGTKREIDDAKPDYRFQNTAELTVWLIKNL